MRIFIKLGGLLCADLTSKIVLPQDFRDARTARQNLKYSRLKHDPRIYKLTERIKNEGIAPLLIGDDLESLGLNCYSSEDFRVYLRLLGVGEICQTIPILLIPDEGIMLVEADPYMTAHDWRFIGTALGSWCAENFPAPATKTSLEIAKWSEWRKKYNLEDANDIAYTKWYESFLHRAWLRLPMDVSGEWMKKQNKNITSLVTGIVGKKASFRAKSQTLTFVVDPFERGIGNLGLQGDRKKIEAYEKLKKANKKRVDEGLLEKRVKDFLEGYSQLLLARQEYKVLLLSTVGKYKSFDQFVADVKSAAIPHNALDILQRSRQEWVERSGAFKIFQYELEKSRLNYYVSVATKAEMRLLEENLKFHDLQREVHQRWQDVEILIKDADKIVDTWNLPSFVEKLLQNISDLHELLQDESFSSEKEKKMLHGYDFELRAQILTDYALNSICQIYHYAVLTPSKKAKDLLQDIISSTAKLLYLKANTLEELNRKIQLLEMDSKLVDNIPRILQDLAVKKSNNSKLKEYWQAKNKAAKEGNLFLPDGIVRKIVNANHRYKGFEEEQAWEEYFESHPRTEEVSIYEGEPDFTFSWLRAVYQDLDVFEK